MAKPTSGAPKRNWEDELHQVTLLGTGHTSKCWLMSAEEGTSSTEKQLYAVKEVPKASISSDEQVARIMAEKRILSDLSHPGIVKLHGSFQTSTTLNFVLDVVGGGELASHIRGKGGFSMDVAKFYAAEVLVVLNHLHSRGVAYRDLKSANILLRDTGHICFIDFGFAKEIERGRRTSSFLGTPPYMAPELLRGDSGISSYDPYAVDCWAYGVLLYEMLTGSFPFSIRHKGDIGDVAESARGGLDGSEPTGVVSAERVDDAGVRTSAAVGKHSTSPVAGGGGSGGIGGDCRTAASGGGGASGSAGGSSGGACVRGRGELYASFASYDTSHPVFSTLPDGPVAADLISKLLCVDPSSRLGVGDGGISQIMDHPWFHSIDWREIEAWEAEPPTFDRSYAEYLDGDELTAEEDALFAGF